MSIDSDDVIILEPERARLTRISRETWKREEKAGRAPARLQLSPRRIGWRKRDVLQWIESRAKRGLTLGDPTL